jgi:putative DNA primase/helicase
MCHEFADRCKDRWPSILMQLGLLNGAALKGKDSPCPMCGGRDRFRFSDKGFGRWFCRGCGSGGDGVHLVQAIKGVDFLEAARLIEAVVGEAPQTPFRSSGADKPRDPLKPWRKASPNVLGSPVDIYLRSRAIEVSEAEARSLRFHSALWHWPTQSKNWAAMVALVSRADGTELTSHQTFLEPDGSGKAPLGDKSRLFPGGASPLGGGVWFGEPNGDGEFVVCEGVENLLSALRVFGVTAGCAALSALGVSRLILPPEAHRVRIFADHDEEGQGLAAARETCRRWRAEGREVAVSLAERVGEDANDVWMRRLGLKP